MVDKLVVTMHENWRSSEGKAGQTSDKTQRSWLTRSNTTTTSKINCSTAITMMQKRTYRGRRRLFSSAPIFPIQSVHPIWHTIYPLRYPTPGQPPHLLCNLYGLFLTMGTLIGALDRCPKACFPCGLHIPNRIHNRKAGISIYMVCRIS